MGVDADYAYGYMVNIADVEWDIDYLKSKFDLNNNLTGYLSEYTYADLIQWLEDGEVDDWDDIEKIIGLKSFFAYDEQSLYFTHVDVMRKFPDRKIGEFDQLVKEYAKETGVKNYEIFKWDEFGYFS